MLAIAGGKGGCGKTTTTYRLGRALAADGRSPLLVDADVEMPDLHRVTGVPREPGLPAVADGRRPASVAHAPVGHPALAVLPAAGAGTDALDAAAPRLRGWDGPVLLDCPAGAMADAVGPLRVADRTLLVSTPRRRSLRDAVKTAAMARELDAPPLLAVLVETSPADDAATVPTEPARAAMNCPVAERIPYVSSGDRRTQPVRTGYRRVARKVQQRNI
ncbi:MinD/ParA family ATP-binding protein [Halorientalis pallida]|uniref:CDP-4-dehydro-6-deoxy-D-gulose 4-reductase n=1 Tax=Halorientalis pallida TaxID=2479928 RepID=A0A498KZ30_9EURY|nr:P-loop NTPase [Halorientalis pallida]RXK51288.1 CDP-4-dehydro-6-deoxy-D-gulose 4-reductase [Halorientalis pallida]